MLFTFAAYRHFIRKSVIEDHKSHLQKLVNKNVIAGQNSCTILKAMTESDFIVFKENTKLCSRGVYFKNFQLKNFNQLYDSLMVPKNQDHFHLFRDNVKSSDYRIILRENFKHSTKILNSINIKFLSLVLPLILGFYLLVLWISMNLSRPLRKVLAKVSKFEEKMSFENKIKLLYNNDEWTKIELALTEAEERLTGQLDELKDEHEKSKILLESINDAILAVDYFHNSLFYNSKFSNYFMKDHDETDKVKLWKIFDSERIINKFNKCLKKGNTVFVKNHKAKIGETIHYFDISIAPLKNNKEDIVGAVGVFHDMTESKLTEQMRVDFVANVSHEIRTPLTSIKGFGQMLQASRNKLDEDLVFCLDKIIDNSERLISLFNDLLKLSTIESTYEILKEQINLEEMISGIEVSLRPVYPNKDIELDLKLNEEFIWADHKLIEQVFTNLMDNSCKYSPAEKLKISIESSRVGKFVEIKINDNGPGIDSEHLDRIFERFYRVEQSRDNSIKGTGLGLSIVKHIINKHNGTIRVEQRSSQGTRFVITLPLEQ